MIIFLLRLFHKYLLSLKYTQPCLQVQGPHSSWIPPSFACHTSVLMPRTTALFVQHLEPFTMFLTCWAKFAMWSILWPLKLLVVCSFLLKVGKITDYGGEGRGIWGWFPVNRLPAQISLGLWTRKIDTPLSQLLRGSEQGRRAGKTNQLLCSFI